MSAPMPLTPEGFAAALPDVFDNVSRETLPALEAYAAILTAWQSRMNLVGPSTLADPWRRHFLDSAQLYPLLPANDVDSARKLKIFDLGSGAGFPGLVLAVLARHDRRFPGGRPLRVNLVESDRKKAAFLAEAARAVGLAAADTGNTAIRIRAQRAEAIEPQIADVVTARALAPLDRLLPWMARFCGEKTILLIPKGEQAEAELQSAAKDWKMKIDRVPSRSDARGTILVLTQLARK
ncbi:MAG: 16S rRNA (guanine(527)-N(7))-methyltransferase RsmG [Reyranellaceae bacterium]